MADRYQLRHQDYLMRVGTVPAGQTVRGVSLQLDTDAAFVLRGRAVHIQPPAATGQVDQLRLVSYFDRYTGPDEQYFSQAVTRFGAENRNFGQFGQFLPVRTPVVYPPGGTIQADVFNGGANDINGVEIYFRGSKIFAPGSLSCETYPTRFSPMPFDYVMSPLPGLPGYNPGVAQIQVQDDPRYNVVQNIASDADFVLRSLSIGAWGTLACPGPLPSQLFFQLYVQLKDQQGKPYSNLPVHADTCFGVNNSNWGGGCAGDQSSFLFSLGAGPFSQLQDRAIGTNHPPLLLPEIYIPRNGLIYLDLIRQDGYLIPAAYPAGTLAPVDVTVRFGGMKVFLG